MHRTILTIADFNSSLLTVSLYKERNWLTKVLIAIGYTPTVFAFELWVAYHSLIPFLIGQMKTLGNKVAKMLAM